MGTIRTPTDFSWLNTAEPLTVVCGSECGSNTADKIVIGQYILCCDCPFKKFVREAHEFKRQKHGY